jgi:hypothetical protein
MSENALKEILKEIEHCSKMIREIEDISLKHNIDPASNPAYNCIVARKIAFADILKVIRRDNAGKFNN